MDSDTGPEPRKLWLPPSYRRPDPKKVSADVPQPVRYRRTLLQVPILSACVIIAALWVMVWFGQPLQRDDATIWCGTTLAIVIAALVGTHWPSVKATATHLSWVAVPWPGDVQWKNIRSAQMLDGTVPRTRVPSQWLTFVVHDPVRNRDVTRNLSTRGLPRHELFSHFADLAADSNPGLATTLRQMAAAFEPTSRLQAFGSRTPAYWVACIIGLSAATAAVLTAILN